MGPRSGGARVRVEGEGDQVGGIVGNRVLPPLLVLFFILIHSLLLLLLLLSRSLHWMSPPL